MSKRIIAFISLGGIIALGLVFTWAAFMHTVTVEPGEHLVMVDKPYFFGHEGTRPEPLTDGRILLFKTTTTYNVNMKNQSVQVVFDDFSTADNSLLDFETTIQYRYTDAVKLIDKFGVEWFANNVNRQYAAIVRDALKKRSMPQMMSDVASAKEVDDEVTAALQKLIADSGLPVEILGVSLGKAKPNATVLEQMNQTNAQQQRQKTLVAAKAAEIDRKAEQEAKAAADNAYRNAMNLSPDQFVKLREIEAYSAACAKAAHCIITSGQSNLLIGGGK